MLEVVEENIPNASDTDDRTTRFLRLLNSYEGSLRGYIFSLVPNWADAEDIAQETRFRLWGQFDTYDPRKDFGNWARAIAYYQVLTYRKKSIRSWTRLGEDFLRSVAEESARMSNQHDARADALQYCLGRLGPVQQDMILRCHAAGKTVADVARELGRGIRGTQQAVTRIRLLLQECVERIVSREDSV